MKKLTGIAVLFAAIVINAYASPTGTTTNNLFVMPQDDYMSVQWYPRVGLENFFATAGLSGAANLGFAAKAGNAYIGVSYNGHLFRQVDIGYTETKAPFNGGADKTFKTYDANELESVASLYHSGPYHNLGILIGVADMGFRLGFFSTYQLFEIKEDSAIEEAGPPPVTTSIKSAKFEGGQLNPSFTWGMAKDLTPNGIRPRVGLSLRFGVSSTEVEPYMGATTRGKLINTDNSTGIGLSFNLGGYTLKRTESGFTTSVDFTYNFSTTFYGENQYSWVNTIENKINTEKKKGRFVDNGTNQYFITDIMDMSHTITPSLKVIWNSDRVGLGTRLDLPVSINSSGDARYSMNNYSGSSYEYQKLDSTSSVGVSFDPYLYLGSQFRLVPNKFNINIGAGIDLSGIGQNEKETKDFVADTDSKEVDAITSGTNSYFRVGATLFLTKNVSLDAYTGVSYNRSFNFTGTWNSLTTFGGILLSLKF